MRRTPLSVMVLGILWASSVQADPPAPGFGEYVGTQYSGQDFEGWQQRKIGEKDCRLSPLLSAPEGYEINHHHVVVDYTGDGTVELGLLHSADSLRVALTKSNLLRPLKKITAGQPDVIASPYKQERHAWLIVHTQGNVQVTGVRYACWRGKETVYGHAAGRFEFGGAILPYRLMYPRNYDPKGDRRYPLVLSVSGSGGVGHDNIKQMEMVVFARFLFTNFYETPEAECFSLVPQAPDEQVMRAFPAPYFPAGQQGLPDEFHPDTAVVNENGWYVQATLALIDSLLKDQTVRIDPDRVYVAGFSLGGKGCWEFLRAGRTVFAAGVAGAGWPIGPAFSEPAGKFADRLKLEMSRHKHIPVSVFAGEKDKMVLGTRAAHSTYQAIGGKSTLTEVKGADHVQSSSAWTDPTLVTWLFGQNRKNNPPAGNDPYPGGVYPGAPTASAPAR